MIDGFRWLEEAVIRHNPVLRRGNCKTQLRVAVAFAEVGMPFGGRPSLEWPDGSVSLLR